MPKDKEIKKVLVIGSGPIVIGQAAEFDYAGTQACRALKENGISVVLVNSNPATIMTDKEMADKVYLEPLKEEVLKNIIKIEKPDSILPTLGGQTGLNLAVALSESGFLKEHNVRLLGTNVETIKKAEDREMFKDTMLEIGEPVIDSVIVSKVEDAVEFAEKNGLPIIIRPAYTLGGTGGGIAETMAELKEIAAGGIKASRVGQILVEKSVAGYKEIEFEVMRDKSGKAIIVCDMENIDPVGIHTGDSVVVAPCQTLEPRQLKMLKDASLKIINALGIEGGCNIQYALSVNSDKYYLIEVNPRVSRSSALASKATGYPIARVSALVAIGYNLDEIVSSKTGMTFAHKSPNVDYVVCKFPRWPFDKFTQADRHLGSQMKATGEVMAIGRTAEEALHKAVRSLEIDEKDLFSAEAHHAPTDMLEKKLRYPQDDRLFYLAEAFRRGYSLKQTHDLTKISPYFLDIVKHLVELEDDLSTKPFDVETLITSKKYGFSDVTIARLWHTSLQEVRKFRKQNEILPVYKMIDTCAAEFASSTPYFYSAYDHENESQRTKKPSILVLGSGPIRSTALRQFNGLATKQLSSILIQKLFQQISRFPINSISSPSRLKMS